MARPSFQIRDDIDEWVESRLVAGQAKSVWYRYATKTIMQCDPILDEMYERYQYEKRQEFVEAAVKEKVDRMKVESGTDNGYNNEP